MHYYHRINKSRVKYSFKTRGAPPTSSIFLMYNTNNLPLSDAPQLKFATVKKGTLDGGTLIEAFQWGTNKFYCFNVFYEISTK